LGKNWQNDVNRLLAFCPNAVFGNKSVHHPNGNLNDVCTKVVFNDASTNVIFIVLDHTNVIFLALGRTYDAYNLRRLHKTRGIVFQIALCSKHFNVMNLRISFQLVLIEGINI